MRLILQFDPRDYRGWNDPSSLPDAPRIFFPGVINLSRGVVLPLLKTWRRAWAFQHRKSTERCVIIVTEI